MAGRKSVKFKRTTKKRRATKLEALANPTQRTVACMSSINSAKMLRFDTPGLLSQMNSKLYRQGRNYSVRLNIVQPQTRTRTEYKIFTLPNTWFTHGAIKHAFKNYKAAMQDELSQTGGKHARWHDFRIKLTDPDGTDGEADAVVWTGGNWLTGPTVGDSGDSSVTNSAGTSISFHVVGDISNSYNILQQYALYLNSRRTPAADFAGPTSYEGMFEGADDLDKLMELGDQPPYSIDYLGLWDANEDGTLSDASTALSYQDTIYIGRGNDSDDTSTSASGSKVISKVFDAPLGIVYVHTSQTDFLYTDGEGGPELALEAMPGNYKGVKSSPIFRHNLAGATAKSM